MATPTPYEELCATSDHLYSLLNKYEVARRRVYFHVNLRYDVPNIEARSMRTDKLFYVRLNGACKDCNNRHTRLSIKAYLMWQVNAPFLCRHKKSIETVRIEESIATAESKPEIYLPTECVPVELEGATESSGGEVTADKLSRDLKRIRRHGRKALDELTKVIDHVSKFPAPANFPELDYDLLVDKKAAMQNKKEEVENILKAQIEGRKQVEKDFEVENGNGLNVEDDQEETPQNPSVIQPGYETQDNVRKSASTTPTPPSPSPQGSTLPQGTVDEDDPHSTQNP